MLQNSSAKKYSVYELSRWLYELGFHPGVVFDQPEIMVFYTGKKQKPWWLVKDHAGLKQFIPEMVQLKQEKHS